MVIMLTGYVLIKRIQQNSDLKKIPVIFLTAESNPEIIKEVEKVGFTSWITKPYRSDVLLKKIENAINHFKE